jgi:hypothetical protein
MCREFQDGLFSCKWSFAKAVHRLCLNSFESLTGIEPAVIEPTLPGSCSRENNDENQRDMISQPVLSQPAVQGEGKIGTQDKEGLCPHNKRRPEGDCRQRDSSREVDMSRLSAVQVFAACLYTQDVVPEEFVHQILDFHRFDGSSEWPEEARNAGLGSAVDMLLYCGKRLEKLGSLKHVMPDLYTYLRKMGKSNAISEELRMKIVNVLDLREKGWVTNAETMSE